MNTFIVICLFAAVIVGTQGAGLTADQSAKVRAYFGDCIQSSGASKEVVTKARNGEFADDDKLDAFFFCMFRKADFITEDGKLNADVIKTKIPSDIKPEEVARVFAACGAAKGDTPQKIALNAYKCYLTETPVKIHLA